MPVEAARAVRRRLPDERRSITHKFSIGGHEGYLTVGMYDDGTPGELFVVMAKEGSVVSGLMDSFATAISLALQYGVPLQVLADKFSHTRFEPSGFTGNPDIPIAKSITDYIFRWLSLKFDKPTLEEGELYAGRDRGQGPADTRACDGAGGGRAAPLVPEPAGRAALPHVWRDHVQERRLLQVQQLRRHERLQLDAEPRVRSARGGRILIGLVASPRASGAAR